MTNERILSRTLLLTLLAGGLAAACGDDDDGDGDPGDTNPEEIITTVDLTFTSTSAPQVTARFRDLDGEGGNPAVITQPAALRRGVVYTLAVDLQNESASPPESITEEIEEEAEEHLFFFPTTGNVVEVAITDRESTYVENMVGADLPVGLASRVTARAAGAGTLRVVLKHLPPVGGTPQKTASTTIDDGETDIDVSFDIRVE